jgi:hypothetical protein
MSGGEIAPGIPAKPRRMRGPVSWLLGPQFLSAARRIARAAQHGDRVDPRNWMSARASSFELPEGADELWFDFIADSGDSQRSTYAVAALCGADLFLEPSAGSERVRVAFRGASDSRLPRGQFLLVGGDTAYHVASRPSLLTRFVAPFAWAARDLQAAGLLPAAPRALFGIPGDHDYFDELRGFHSQFRRPPAASGPGDDASRLTVPAYRTCQDASYFALRLPFAWSVWGVDCMGGLDARQREFFQREAAEVPPRKLIVATHFPTAAMGRVQGHRSPVRAAFSALGLPLPLLESDQPLPEGHARLDLAGDLHNYERYSPAESTNYASIVAGIGGAFLHPSHVDHGELPREAVFPPVPQSARLVARRLFSPWLMLSGGYVAFWTGLVSALLLVCAAIAPGVRIVLGLPFGERGGDLGPFLRGLGLFGTPLLALALAAASWSATRRVHRRSFISAGTSSRGGARTNVWSYRYALLLGLAALATPFAGIIWLGTAPARALLGASVFATLVLGLTGGLAAVGALVGGAESRGLAARVGFGALGALHGAAQLSSGVILARAGFAWAAGYVAFIALYGFLLGPRLSPKTAGPRRARDALTRAAPLMGGWLVALGLLAAPIALGDGALPTAGWPMVGRLAIAALAGGILAPLWLGWYLAISLAAGGHYNEAAGASRIERGKGLVRVRVRRDHLMVFVIGLDEVATDIDNLRPVLVDRFEVHAAQPSPR